MLKNMSSIFDKWYTDMTKAACEINFHDSTVTSVKYDPKTFTLVISIDFCNWAQTFYTEGEPEVITLHLYFYRAFIDMDPGIVFDGCYGDIYHVVCEDKRTLKFVIDTKKEEDQVKEIKAIAEELYFRREVTPFDDYNCIIAESERYAVVRDCEDCYLMFKDRSKSSVSVGDFYGDANLL